MRKPWIRTICGLPCANRGSKLCSTIHGLSAQTVGGSTLCARQSQAAQTKGTRRNRREGLQLAAQANVRDSYLGLGILRCSLWGLGYM